MSELTEIEATMKALKKQLNLDANELMMVVKQFVEEATKPRGSNYSRNSTSGNSIASSQSSQPTGGKKKEKKKEKNNKDKSGVDFDIPSCYGTIELRETLVRAGKSLTEGIDLLGKTKPQMPSQYVQREMEELSTNFVILKEAFAQLWGRMEMNGVDLGEESSAPPSKEDVTLMKSLG